MLFSASTLLFLFNLTLASLLCAGFTLCVVKCCRALPKQHATLVVGLVACLSAVVLVGLGSLFSLGQFSAFSVSSSEIPASSALTPQMNEVLNSDLDPISPAMSVQPINELVSEVSQNAEVRSENNLAPATTVDVTVAPSRKSLIDASDLSQGTFVRLGSLLICAWLLGSLVFAALRIRDWCRCLGLIRISSPNDDRNLEKVFNLVAEQLQLRRKPRLMVSHGLPAPIVVGVFHPIVIFPADVGQLFSAQQLRSVLVHELSHVARKDHWVVGLQILATTLYWWNPFVWRVSNKIAEVRELICDDIAVGAQQMPREYAQSILVMAERVVSQRETIATLGISSSSKSDLERRILRIISSKTAALETRLNRWSIAAVSLFAAVLITGVLFAQVPSENAQGLKTGTAETLEQSDAPQVSNKFGKPNQPASRISGQVIGADGRPAAEAKVRVVGRKSSEIDATVVTDADGRFDFTLHFEKPFLWQSRFWAQSGSGDEIGFYRFRYEEEKILTEGIEIKLETTRNAEVEVVDAEGRTIADAQVVFSLEFPIILQGYKTNDNGKALVKLPTSERITSVAVWKDHEGFDYRIYDLNRFEKGNVNAVAPKFSTQQPERLILDGVTPLTVQVVNDENEPIEGVDIYPWLLRKKGAPDSFNLSFFADLFSEKTNAAGFATIDWMPTWQKQKITVWPRAKGYESPRGNYDPEVGEGKLQLQLNRLVPIRGQVVDGEDNPVSGVEVMARGVGRALNSFRASVSTNEAGQYEMLVAPNQNYLLIARNSNSVSASQTGILVFPNQPLEDRDFQLRKPTRVHGRLMNERTQKPIPNDRVIVYQYGTGLNDIADGKLPNPENERTWLQPVFVHDAMTNDKGEFEFQLGDGDFDIRPPTQSKAEKFEIAGQDELELTVTTKVKDEFELQGLVTAKSDGTPIENARVIGVPRSFLSDAEWRLNTGSDGRFDVLRIAEPTYVYVTNPDKSLAAIVEIGEEERELEMQLEPVAVAYGRLIDDQKPVAGQKIYYNVDVPDLKKGMWSPRFGGQATTDSQGKFKLESLAPNWKYKVSLPAAPEGSIPNLTTVIAKPGESKDLGDLKKPAPYKPYVEPTLEERIQTAFTVEGTPLERLSRGLTIAKLVDQHLLVVFGQPEHPSIRSLMDIRFNDAEFRPFRDDYRPMAIPTDVKHLSDAKALAKHLSIELNEAQQDFYLVVVDANGKTIVTTGLDELATKNELSKEKLFDLLRQHQTQPIDARKLLDDALKRAVKEDKRVLVQETATWCGPCHRLSRLLNSNRIWEEDYIWIKMDHRWTGAKEVMSELRDGADGGVPWFAILNAQGEKLATSNDPETGDNIGFPAKAEGQTHFADMFNDTRKRMSESDVQSLVASIKSTK